MKQVSYLFASAMMIMFAIYTQAEAKTVRNTTGGSGGKYYAVSRIEDGSDVTINCSGSGDESCPTNAVKQIDQQLLDYAIAQIQIGNLSGSYGLSGSTVTWISDGTLMNNSSINVD